MYLKHYVSEKHTKQATTNPVSLTYHGVLIAKPSPLSPRLICCQLPQDS